jgi:predicted lactoylglutathione lyase
MLLEKERFATFSKRPLSDSRTQTGALYSFSVNSRAEVDEMVKKAIAAGGSYAKDPQDHGFMYGWSFYDLDGHHWEVFWMDPSAIPT